MKKELTRVLIDEGVLSYIQRLDYECAGLRNLNCQIIRSGGLALEERNKWLEQYKTAFSELQIAMNEVIAKVLPECTNMDTKYYIDFRSSELVAYLEITQ